MNPLRLLSRNNSLSMCLQPPFTAHLMLFLWSQKVEKKQQAVVLITIGKNRLPHCLLRQIQRNLQAVGQKIR